jgi:hypothetical protein
MKRTGHRSSFLQQSQCGAEVAESVVVREAQLRRSMKKLARCEGGGSASHGSYKLMGVRGQVFGDTCFLTLDTRSKT